MAKSKNHPRKRRPDGAQLQLSARIVRPRGVPITKDVLLAGFERWIDGETTEGIEYRLTLWDGREIGPEPPSQTPRWTNLREAIRRLLRAGRIPLGKVGETS